MTQQLPVPVTVPASATASAPDLREFTGYLLRRAYTRSTGFAQACVTDDTRLRELAALSALAEQGAIPQRRLGELCQISPTVVVKLVDGLEGKGLVARERSATDRRVQALRLTAAGAAALDGQRHNLDQAEERLTAELSAAEVARLKLHLRALLAGSPVLDASDLADHAGYLIAHAHRQLRDHAARRLAELQLHPRDFGLLANLAGAAPSSQAQLADRLGVSPPAVLALLDMLEARHLVRRVRSSQDRRVQEVTLTELGRETLAAAQRSALAIQREILERLGADADADLRALLTRLIA
jgi:DNA-binding MarR family transcriptional regulator